MYYRASVHTYMSHPDFGIYYIYNIDIMSRKKCGLSAMYATGGDKI